MVEEYAKLHAVAASPSFVCDNLFKKILGIERRNAPAGIVQGEILIRTGADLVDVERCEILDVEGRF